MFASMLRLSFLATLVAWPAPAQDVERSVTARVDPRVELMSLVFRLAGNPEYSQARLTGYAKDADTWFGKHKDHAVVRRARALRKSHGVSFDAVMGLAVHLHDAVALEGVVPLAPRPQSLDQRWPEAELAEFLREARGFVAETRFADFLTQHAELYKTASERLQATLDKGLHLEWFDAFFGGRPQARFELAIGLLNGPANYGPRVQHADGREDLHCVLGAWLVDAEGNPRFDAGVLATVVHEFCHSYCNPLVDANFEALRAPGEALYRGVAEVMQSQAYSNARTMLCESLVRASVVRWQAAHGGPAAVKREVAEQVKRGFAWTGALAELLAEYEKSRDRYPKLADFMPRIVELFAAQAKAAASKAPPPTVVAMEPKNGARDVDPALTELRVTFDRPMKDGAWAFVRVNDRFPETTGKASYDAKRTTVTLPVKLEPERQYELWLNRGQYSSFQSQDGVMLAPVRVTFETGKARKRSK